MSEDLGMSTYTSLGKVEITGYARCDTQYMAHDTITSEYSDSLIIDILQDIMIHQGICETDEHKIPIKRYDARFIYLCTTWSSQFVSISVTDELQ